eukprot:scaffold10907_cov38-Prasinocladus_malaysianus.AAC.1
MPHKAEERMGDTPCIHETSSKALINCNSEQSIDLITETCTESDMPETAGKSTDNVFGAQRGTSWAGQPNVI